MLNGVIYFQIIGQISHVAMYLFILREIKNLKKLREEGLLFCLFAPEDMVENLMEIVRFRMKSRGFPPHFREHVNALGSLRSGVGLKPTFLTSSK